MQEIQKDEEAIDKIVAEVQKRDKDIVKVQYMRLQLKTANTQRTTKKGAVYFLP